MHHCKTIYNRNLQTYQNKLSLSVHVHRFKQASLYRYGRKVRSSIVCYGGQRQKLKRPFFYLFRLRSIIWWKHLKTPSGMVSISLSFKPTRRLEPVFQRFVVTTRSDERKTCQAKWRKYATETRRNNRRNKPIIRNVFRMFVKRYLHYGEIALS